MKEIRVRQPCVLRAVLAVPWHGRAEGAVNPSVIARHGRRHVSKVDTFPCVLVENGTENGLLACHAGAVLAWYGWEGGGGPGLDGGQQGRVHDGTEDGTGGGLPKSKGNKLFTERKPRKVS